MNTTQLARLSAACAALTEAATELTAAVREESADRKAVAAPAVEVKRCSKSGHPYRLFVGDTCLGAWADEGFAEDAAEVLRGLLRTGHARCEWLDRAAALEVERDELRAKLAAAESELSLIDHASGRCDYSTEGGPTIADFCAGLRNERDELRATLDRQNKAIAETRTETDGVRAKNRELNERATKAEGRAIRAEKQAALPAEFVAASSGVDHLVGIEIRCGEYTARVGDFTGSWFRSKVHAEADADRLRAALRAALEAQP